MEPKGRVQELPKGIPPPRPAGGLALPRPATPPARPGGLAPPAPAEDASSRPTAAKPVRSARIADLVTASLLLALGGVVVGESLRMGIGWGSDGPESGFVPFWLATILLGSCLTIIVRALRSASEKSFVTRGQLARVLTVLLPATAMILLVPFLGLYVTSALYMGTFMRWGGRHGWAASIALPLAFVVLIFLVFERWFLVPLPKGPLEAWLGY